MENISDPCSKVMCMHLLEEICEALQIYIIILRIM